MVKVSVIIPVYNSQEYISRCLDSILSQSLKDIEIICVDDMSMDKSVEIMERYAVLDDRIHIIKNVCNGGAGYSRNAGIERAQGEYVQFVDSDDYLEPEALEALYTASHENKSDMCFFKMTEPKEGDSNRRAKGITGSYMGLHTGDEILGLFVENKEFFYYSWCVMIRKEFLECNNIRFQNLRIGEGGAFVLSLLFKADRVLVSDGRYYNYCDNSESVMATNKESYKVLYGQFIQYILALKELSKSNNEGLKLFLDYQYKKVKAGAGNLSLENADKIQGLLEDSFSKHIFYTFMTKRSYDVKFSEKDIDNLKNSSVNILYGAGYACKDVLSILNEYQIEIFGIAVADTTKNPKSLFGHKVYDIAKLESLSSKAAVVVTANKKYRNEIEEMLLEKGFKNNIFLDIEI